MQIWHFEMTELHFEMPCRRASFYEDAFFGCNALKELHIPALYTDTLRPTESLYSLEAFVIAKNNPSYTAVGGVAFDKDGTTLLKYPVWLCREAVYYVPQGTKAVADYAFFDAAFSGVVFPESVETNNTLPPKRGSSVLFMRSHFRSGS